MIFTRFPSDFTPKNAYFTRILPLFRPARETQGDQSARRPLRGVLCCQARVNESIGRPKNLSYGAWDY